RYATVTGVQTCALPIYRRAILSKNPRLLGPDREFVHIRQIYGSRPAMRCAARIHGIGESTRRDLLDIFQVHLLELRRVRRKLPKIGRASGREGGEILGW